MVRLRAFVICCLYSLSLYRQFEIWHRQRSFLIFLKYNSFLLTISQGKLKNRDKLCWLLFTRRNSLIGCTNTFWVAPVRHAQIPWNGATLESGATWKGMRKCTLRRQIAFYDTSNVAPLHGTLGSVFFSTDYSVISVQLLNFPGSCACDIFIFDFLLKYIIPTIIFAPIGLSYDTKKSTRHSVKWHNFI